MECTPKRKKEQKRKEKGSTLDATCTDFQVGFLLLAPSRSSWIRRARSPETALVTSSSIRRSIVGFVCVCVCVFTFIKVPETGGLGRRGWSRRRCGRRKNRHSNLCGVENGVCATQNGDAHGVGPNRTTDDDSSAAGGIVGGGRSRAGQVRPAPPATAAAATTTTTSSDRFAQHVRPLGRSAGRQQRGQMSVFPSLTCTGGGGGGGSFVRARVSPSHRDHSTRLTARTANRITLLLHQVAVRTWCAVLRRLLSVVLQRPRPAGGLDAARRSGY